MQDFFSIHLLHDKGIQKNILTFKKYRSVSALTDTGENVQKWMRVFSTRR